MKKGFRISFLIIGFFLFAIASATYVIRKEPWLSAEAAFQKGDNYIRKGMYKRAFHYIKMAADKEPGNSHYTWIATQRAVEAGNANAAYFYAQKTWKNGRKERDVLNTLVRFSFFSDKKQKLEYALSLVKQMGDNIDKDDLRAELYLSFGDSENARRLWEQRYARAPLPGTAVKLALTYAHAGNDSLALSFLQSCRTKQKLDDEGYGVLARLYTKKGDLREAERCYREAAELNRSSDKLEYNHAVFLMSTKNYDQAALMLDSLVMKYPENKNFETMRISALLAKGDAAGALRECDNSSAQPRIAPLRARALIRLKRFAEAEAAYDTALSHTSDIRVRLEYGNFLLYGLKKSDKARGVFQAVHAAQPEEPVANLGLATLALDAKDVSGAKKYIALVLSGKKPAPYAYLLLAQADLLEGNPREAIDNCDKTLAAMPGFEKAIFVQSLAYAQSGRPDKAEEILSALVLRVRSDPEKSRAIKRALLTLKMQQKKYDEALKILGELERGGAAADLGRMRLEIYALSGNCVKAEEMLASLKASLDKNDYCYYQSRIAELRGDTVKAAAILESDLSSKRSFLRWAGLRIKMGKVENVMDKFPKDSMTVADWSRLASIAERSRQYGVAAQCYKQALKLDEGNAALLNNYAWVSMQLADFNHEEVLKAVKKAYSTLSDRSEVLQTYAEALNKCDKPAECITLLQDKPAQSRQSASLLYQLGSAYEKTGDLRGAISSFRMALAFPESTLDWPSGVRRNDLQARVKSLQQKLEQ